jgi:antitoxin ParD1/3/4
MDTTTMNVSLPEAMKEYIEAKVAAGGYSTASEYIRELVRQDQKREAEAKLESLLLEGLHRGPATAWTKDDLEAIRREAAKRVEAKKKTAA